MKRIISIIFLISTVLFGTSCDDFLDVKSKGQLTLDNFFTNYEDCRAATAPLYSKVWFDFNNTFYYGLGDGRGNNIMAPWSPYIYPYVNLTETGLTATLGAAWNAYHVVVVQADHTINNLDNALANGVSEQSVNQCKAEARFMRGTAYWYLANLWKNVIIMDDPAALIGNFVVNTNPYEDVLEFAIRDLEFAAEWLPESDSQKGRLTKWSALGMLSRFYITAANYARGGNYTASYAKTADEYYALAKEAARQVCEQSGLQLVDKYEDVFKVQFNNNGEALFSLQWVPNSDYGTINFAQSYLAHNSEVVGGYSAWGNATYASGDIIELMHNRKDHIRRKATFFCHGETYDYLGGDLEEGKYVVDNSGAEYKPWIKKGVVGSAADTDGLASDQNSAWMTPMLRLGEVYLLYAEAALGTNSTLTEAKPLEYFNLVRERAGLRPLASVTLADIWNERRCELAMEGQFWFDMVRRAFWDEAYVLEFMSNQKRNQSYQYKPLDDSFEWGEDIDVDQNVPSARRLTLPYPEVELVQNPKLNEDPVPYKFEE